MELLHFITKLLDIEDTNIKIIDVINRVTHKEIIAKLEATNNLIKLIKRNAFAFRNFENFKKRIFITLNIKKERTKLVLSLAYLFFNPLQLTKSPILPRLSQPSKKATVNPLLFWIQKTIVPDSCNESGRQDSNLRHLGPKPSTLPS